MFRLLTAIFRLNIKYNKTHQYIKYIKFLEFINYDNYENDSL